MMSDNLNLSDNSILTLYISCSNCKKLNNINYPFSLEAVECERLLFC